MNWPVSGTLTGINFVQTMCLPASSFGLCFGGKSSTYCLRSLHCCHVAYESALDNTSKTSRCSPCTWVIAVIYIVYVIESAVYGVIFTSCLCENPNERGTSE